MIPAHVYGDPEIFALERDRLFARSWVFLAHESEIPDPGDYVVRRVLADSFIVARDEAGVVRVMFNMCLHRGMQVCRAEMGNASHFRCPYHAWTYRNDGRLAGLPFHEEAYGGEDGFSRPGQSLLPAPSMDTHNGLIFISLDPDAPPLRDYLGDFAFYLDFYTRQSPAGMELRGPQRWRIKANWKIGAENFAGDSYHTPHTHASVVDIGLFREPKASKRKEGALYTAGPGAGTTYKLPPGGDFADQLRYVGYPDAMIPAMAAAVVGPPAGARRGQRLHGVGGDPVPQPEPGAQLAADRRRGTVAPFISLRQWQPVSERETEVLSWFAVDAAAPEEFKRDSYKAYLMCFGSSGMFEQDDVENWVSITDMAAGSMARRLNLNSRMGLTSAGQPIKPPLADFAGPGVAYQGFGEFNQRHWLSQWSDHLEREPGRAPVTAGRPLPYGDPAHLAAHQFLVEEAALLDAADYAGWLDLLCEDIRYVMPVRVTTARGAGFDSLADMGHFDEDMYALRKRVQRLATDHAWTEDPPSRTRHFVTNVRTFRHRTGMSLRVESALLLFRSRGDTREP